jgi:uncharacterized SAM-binding protein YcdF (DUF218 family)
MNGPARGSAALRLLGLAVVGAFVAVAYTPLVNRLQGRALPWGAPGPGDAIVVLGSGMGADGALTARSLRRAVHGVRLYHQGLAPRLVLLGVRPRSGPGEAEARAQLARELGVPEAALLVMSGARTTWEEAGRAWSHLAPGGSRRVLLVTDVSHMERSREAFARAGFEVVPAPVATAFSEPDRPAERLALARSLAQEWLARAYYRLAGYS